MFDRLNDTIVAISSPAGASPRGVIRLSGPEALRIPESIYIAENELTDMPGHRRCFGRLCLEDEVEVPVEVYLFRSPVSYTRQDVVELHVPGSPPLMAMILEKLIAAGGRLAEPGEFTARAFFNGALDLTRVEGVAAVIHARNDAQLRASEALLHGQLSRRTAELRERLADLLALLEAEIDFAEEPIDFVSPRQVSATVDEIRGAIDALVAEAPSMERLGLLPEVVLVGPPNAGKSTLFNRLTGMDRAIRSATAGTTRDVLAVPVTLPGGEVMLKDCAGLGFAAALGIGGGDELEALAERAALDAVQSADMVIAVLDATDGLPPAIGALMGQLPQRPQLILLNKCDRADESTVDRLTTDAAGYGEVLVVSGLTGQGEPSLRERIDHHIFGVGHSHSAETLALSRRQRNVLHEAAAALGRVVDILADGDAVENHAEILAMEIREAAQALSMLTGEITTDDLLGRIFANFCIGK